MMIYFPQMHIWYIDIDESLHNGDIGILYGDIEVYIRCV
jgi:hypothetical protein